MRLLGAIIVDILVFLFLLAHIIIYVKSFEGVDGINTGLFGNGETLYGIQGYIQCFKVTASILLFYIPILPVAAVFDTVVLVVKSILGTLKRFEQIAIIATYVVMALCVIIVFWL